MQSFTVEHHWTTPCMCCSTIHIKYTARYVKYIANIVIMNKKEIWRGVCRGSYHINRPYQSSPNVKSETHAITRNLEYHHDGKWMSNSAVFGVCSIPYTWGSLANDFKWTHNMGTIPSWKSRHFYDFTLSWYRAYSWKVAKFQCVVMLMAWVARSALTADGKSAVLFCN